MGFSYVFFTRKSTQKKETKKIKKRKKKDDAHTVLRLYEHQRIVSENVFKVWQPPCQILDTHQRTALVWCSQNI